MNSEARNEREGYVRYNPGAIKRPTFYMTEELLAAIKIKAHQEHTSCSGFVVRLLSFLLLSPTGQQLQKNALANNRTLAQELEQFCLLLHEQLVLEEVNQLATLSQEFPPQILNHLLLLGLQDY